MRLHADTDPAIVGGARRQAAGERGGGGLLPRFEPKGLQVAHTLQRAPPEGLDGRQGGAGAEVARDVAHEHGPPDAGQVRPQGDRGGDRFVALRPARPDSADPLDEAALGPNQADMAEVEMGVRVYKPRQQNVLPKIDFLGVVRTTDVRGCPGRCRLAWLPCKPR